MRDERDLGIQHDGTENPGIVHGGSKIIDRLLVVRVRTVREVESCNVHSRPQKLFQHRHRPRRRPQSADNLRLRPLLLHLNSSLTAERSRRVYGFFFFLMDRGFTCLDVFIKQADLLSSCRVYLFIIRCRKRQYRLDLRK